MSELQVFNASKLGSLLGSRLHSFGTGKEIEGAISYAVSITWEVTLVTMDTIAHTILSIVSGTITEHGNYFIYQCIGLGTSNDRGTCRMMYYSGKPFNGSIDPINDKVSDFAPIANASAGNFLWMGWSDWTSYTGGGSLTPVTPCVIDTGSSVEMYGEFTALSSSSGSVSANGCLLYGPWMKLVFSGSQWVRSSTLDDIMLYVLGSLSAQSGVGINKQVRARIKATISV